MCRWAHVPFAFRALLFSRLRPDFLSTFKRAHTLSLSLSYLKKNWSDFTVKDLLYRCRLRTLTFINVWMRRKNKHFTPKIFKGAVTALERREKKLHASWGTGSSQMSSTFTDATLHYALTSQQSQWITLITSVKLTFIMSLVYSVLHLSQKKKQWTAVMQLVLLSTCFCSIGQTSWFWWSTFQPKLCHQCQKLSYVNSQVVCVCVCVCAITSPHSVPYSLILSTI